VLTYSQRFSKMPEEGGAVVPPTEKNSKLTGAASLGEAGDQGTLDKLAKVLKNKNNLILDFKENEKLVGKAKSKGFECILMVIWFIFRIPRDLPQLSDTENTSPAIVARRHAHSTLIEESYDIPRSHQQPYYNVNQLLGERPVTSPHNSNPIAASTPNLMAADLGSVAATLTAANSGQISGAQTAASSPTSARTLPRHCYTNAAPTKMEGNVFRYDFMEQADCPPVNRKLKPKVAGGLPALEDKPPEEFPAKPPVGVEHLTNKLGAAQLQQPIGPPSVDRKCKPNVFKVRYKWGYMNKVFIITPHFSWELRLPCRRRHVVPLEPLSPWYCRMKRMSTHRVPPTSTRRAPCLASSIGSIPTVPAACPCNISAPHRQRLP